MYTYTPTPVRLSSGKEIINCATCSMTETGFLLLCNRLPLLYSPTCCSIPLLSCCCCLVLLSNKMQNKQQQQQQQQPAAAQVSVSLRLNKWKLKSEGFKLFPTKQYILRAYIYIYIYMLHDNYIYIYIIIYTYI